MSDSGLEADGYLTPGAAVETELVEKGSRFVCLLASVDGEQAARGRLSEIAALFPGATHCCWAYRLGWPPRERSSDAGEPAGTAGAPILRVLQGRELSDVLAVVVRYFGGTKLGRGGLARAYAGATAAAVAAAVLEARVPSTTLAVEIPYAQVNPVKRVARSQEVEIVGADYGETVRLELRVAEADRAALEAALADLGVHEVAARASGPCSSPRE